MKEAGAAVEIIVPEATIFSEHPAVVIDRNVTPAKRPLDRRIHAVPVERRSAARFRQVPLPLRHRRSIQRSQRTVCARSSCRSPSRLFGGWSKAYPEIIEGVWREQVQQEK